MNNKKALLLMVAMALGITNTNVQAAPGDNINWFNATFVDNSNKNTYNIGFNANESPTEAGVGGVNFFVNGPRLGLSTMHGANIAAREIFDYSTNPPSIVFAPAPLQISLWEQGGAGNQAVSIGTQVVELSAHSWVHSDAPNIVYMGPVTADIRIERKSGQIKVVIYTPKGPIKLEGRLSAPL